MRCHQIRPPLLLVPGPRRHGRRCRPPGATTDTRSEAGASQPVPGTRSPSGSSGPRATPIPPPRGALWSAPVTAAQLQLSDFGGIHAVHPASAAGGSITDREFEIGGTTRTAWRLAQATPNDRNFPGTLDVAAVSPAAAARLEAARDGRAEPVNALMGHRTVRWRGAAQ